MKHVDRNIIQLGWVSFFTDFASSMITILVPIYVVFVLHQGVDKLGFTIAVATFVSYFFRIVSGYISERFDWVKPMVVGGYLVSALSKPLLALTQTYQGVAALRGLERMGKAIRSAPKDTLISAYSEKSHAGAAFGLHKMMDISGELGGAICIYLLLLWLPDEGKTIRLIFASTLLPGLLAVAIVVFRVKDVAQRERRHGRPVLNRNDAHLFPLIGIYCLAIFFIVNDQFMIIRARQAGYATSSIPLLIIVFTLTQTLVSYYSGLISDRIGCGRMLLLAFLFGALSLLSLGLDLIWPGFVLLGLFTVISLNAIRVYISRHARSTAFVFGVFYAGVAISGSLGALVMGQIWAAYGFAAALIFSLTGLTLLLIVMLLLTRKAAVRL